MNFNDIIESMSYDSASETPFAGFIRIAGGK